MQPTAQPQPSHDRELDPAMFEAFLGKMVNDMGAAISGALVITGTKLGLYKALADGGPATSQALAERAGIAERYAREWLSAQAASGFVDYDETAGTFSLSPEQQMVFANEDSPTFMAPALGSSPPPISTSRRSPAPSAPAGSAGTSITNACSAAPRSSSGPAIAPIWSRPGCRRWTAPSRAEREVADIGCGHGARRSSWPRPSRTAISSVSTITRRRSSARARQQWKRGSAKLISRSPGQETLRADFDLVCCFDCLHDMGDPVGASRHIRSMLKDDGWYMLVEPFAGDSLAENLNPVGRLYYSASTMICTPGSSPGSRACAARRPVRRGLPRVLGSRLQPRGRRAAETPFNLVIEARP